MNPQKLESAVLKAIARARSDDWLPCSIGDLRNRMGEIDTDAANASINSIGEAIISLAQEGYLLLGKREHGGKQLSFDFQKRLDEGYIANFFRDSFELKLTHQGRSRVGESAWNTPADEAQDHRFARLAVEEARKSVPENDGRTHPMVGAVVVKSGNVLATAHRGEAKGNHAEYIVLEKRLADAAVAGATVYTTLEPCTTRNHPKIPCVERLIERKVGRVVIGMLDPDPRIRGRGQQRLRSANIITDFFPHDLMTEVEELNREFSRKFGSATGVAEATPQAVEPEAVPPVIPPAAPIARPNLKIEATKVGKIYLQGDIWTLAPGERSREPCFRGLFVDVANVPTASGNIKGVKVKAALTIQSRSYSPLPWLEEYTNAVRLGPATRKTIVLAVGQDRLMGSWCFVLNHRENHSSLKEPSRMDWTNMAPIPSNLPLQILLVDVDSGETVAKFDYLWTFDANLNCPFLKT